MTTILTRSESRALPRTELTDAQRDEMFALLARYFDGVSRPQFESDLAEKNWIIQLRQEGRLVGFSTLHAYETTFEGEPISVIYSGDTIVAPEAWGTPALARAWIATVNRLRLEYPRGPYYWLLLTSGFRTYRFLPVFWREFFPRHDKAIPPPQQRLLDQLARQRFGKQYNPTTGIVRFTRPQRLRGQLSEVATGRTTNSHVSFFLARNSGHTEGDELACLTELCATNLTPAGKRMVETPSDESHCHIR